MGTGRIAHVVAADFKIAELNIQAVGSRNIESAQAFAKAHSIPEAHGSYEELVANPNIDIVFISTLDFVHADNG